MSEPRNMATVYWAVALCVILIGGTVNLILERQQRHKEVGEIEVESLLKEKETADLHKTEERILADIDRVQNRLGLFAGLTPDFEEPRLRNNQRVPFPSKPESSILYPFNWKFRIYIPKDPPELEICWALGDIPKDDSVPGSLSSKAYRCPLEMYSMVTPVRPPGKPYKNWRRSGVINLQMKLGKSDPGERATVSFDTNVTVTKVGKELSDSSTNGTGHYAYLNEPAWLVALAKDPLDSSAIESKMEFDQPDDVISFGQPIVLVKLRAKRKVEDRFVAVDGPSPGVMIWIQKKAEKK